MRGIVREVAWLTPGGYELCNTPCSIAFDDDAISEIFFTSLHLQCRGRSGRGRRIGAERQLEAQTTSE